MSMKNDLVARDIIDLSKMSQEDLIRSFVEVRLKDELINEKRDTTFLSVVETLTRIGIPSRYPDANGKLSLCQSCHILSKFKRSRYFIVHFKELFALDGKFATFKYDDMCRRNTIANLLAEWNLVELVDPKKTQGATVPMDRIKVIKYSERDHWNLVSKYQIKSAIERGSTSDEE